MDWSHSKMNQQICSQTRRIVIADIVIRTELMAPRDSLINVLDISNGLNMDSIISQVNIVQAIASLDFLDDEINYIQAVTTDHNYHILNMYTGVSLFEFDAKNVNFYI